LGIAERHEAMMQVIRERLAAINAKLSALSGEIEAVPDAADGGEDSAVQP
jgi:hypothetical protein